jgi:two-component system, OmpR family, response regulator ResD
VKRISQGGGVDMATRILVVDDDEGVCDLVRIALEKEGFIVDTAFDGKAGLDKALTGGYTVLLLDIMLPEIDGWEICRRIRGSYLKGIPIIMLTARGDEVDRILGLELGADDYVSKPFSPRELVARVKALIRRSDYYNTTIQKFSCGQLSVDPHKHIAKIGNKELDLTPKEMSLLVLLSKQVGTPLTREEILKTVWGFDDSEVMTRTVDEHIKRLRSKIARLDSHNSYIQTIWGVGYKLEVRDSG